MIEDKKRAQGSEIRSAATGEKRTLERAEGSDSGSKKARTVQSVILEKAAGEMEMRESEN